jgi:regulator of protease activity HflC (stomatin/prohibitin superfamily)
MADIRNFAFIRHFRTDPTFHVIKYRSGKVDRSGRGLAFWFLPMSAGIAEVPVDDRELMLMFHARSSDFQDLAVQGVVTFRVTNPERLADRVDFTVDLATGAYTKQPLEKLSLMVTQIAQQHAAAYVTATPLRQVLVEGYERIRALVEAGLTDDRGLSDAGVGIASVRIAFLKPTAELEKALEMPMREKIQQEADQAGFARRALAVDSERAIQENELKNQIEIARREQSLIDQRGQNELKRVQQEADARRVEAEAEAERNRIAAGARAETLRLVELARADGERASIDVYRDLPQSVLLGLAARELAGKLQRIEHLNVTPELFGPLLANLLQAGTDRLKAGGEAP